METENATMNHAPMKKKMKMYVLVNTFMVLLAHVITVCHVGGHAAAAASFIHGCRNWNKERCCEGWVVKERISKNKLQGHRRIGVHLGCSSTTNNDNNNNNKQHSLNMSAAARTVTKRLVGKLHPQSTTFLLCDIQDRFIPLIHNTETVVQTTQLLTSVSKELSIPLVVTEQYKKAFGDTYKDCFREDFGEKPVPFEKKLFSMMTEEVKGHMGVGGEEEEEESVRSFVLFGIEAHVCVQQTALDLLEMGHDVHIVTDACSSMKAYDREMALRRMEGAGAFLTTAQSAVFMLLQSADHPNFKPVSKLVKDHAALPNQFNTP